MWAETVSCWPARGGRLSGLQRGLRGTHFNVVVNVAFAASALRGWPARGPAGCRASSANVVVTSQYRFSQCSFCFGATGPGPPGRLHQFANKVGSLQVVLGWNRQTRSDYLFVVSRLMLMMTRRGTGPGGQCATNTNNLIEAHILLIPLKISLSKLFRDYYY